MECVFAGVCAVPSVSFREFWSMGFRLCEANSHLSDDKAVAKMGHPVLWSELDVGHPSQPFEFP